VATKDLPRLINPQKGYIISANNRLATDHAKTDLGNGITSTARAQRITELIDRKLERGAKFT